MADESTVRGWLTAHAPLTALVSDRIYDQRAPDSRGQPSARPFVVSTVVDDRDFNVLGATQIGAAFVIQFDIYADSKASAKAVLAAMRAALVPHGFEDSARDLPADDPALRRITVTWRFALNR